MAQRSAPSAVGEAPRERPSVDGSQRNVVNNAALAQSDPFNHLTDPETTPAFPTLEPLSHDLALLSPAKTPEFNVDDFLVSRTKASDLSYILSELRTYNQSLKEELVSIINQDYKDFVSLGSGLKSESHRIARLGWSTASSSEESSGGGMGPVRRTLLDSRDTLQTVEDDIRDCLKRREEVGDRKQRLELMLQLHDSVTRLEDLLLIPAEKARRRTSSIGGPGNVSTIISTDDELDPYDDGEESGSSYGFSSDEDDEEADGHYDLDSLSGSPQAASAQKPGGTGLTKSPSPLHYEGKRRKPRRSRLRAPSLGAFSTASRSPPFSRGPSRSVLGPSDSNRQSADGGVAAGPTSLLGLPQRVSRTSAEYSRLRFLSRRVQAEGLKGFSTALQSRVEHIRVTLRQDLRALLRTLLSRSSLLVGGAALSPARATATPHSPTLRRRSSIRPANTGNLSPEAYELESWSQVAPLGPGDGTDEAEADYWAERLQEQRGWLDMVLATLTSLGAPLQSGGTDSGDGLIEPGSGRLANEAEEAVREIMIQSWASETITSSALSSSTAGGPSTGAISNGAHGHDTGRSRARAEAVTIKPEDVPGGDGQGGDAQALLRLYNKILIFAATDAWHVCDAAESISSLASTAEIQSRTAPNQGSAELAEARSFCDIFVNVLCDEVMTRLMDDEVGSTIFFVGRPDAFYRNYAMSTIFLDRLASLAPSGRSKTALLRHRHWSAFRKRWQLPVYFQMRFREIVSKLEENLAAGSQTTDNDTPPLMQATASTLTSLRAPWSDGVHLHELAAREWRVSLQILSRYKTWVESEIPDDLVATAMQSGTVGGSKRIDGLKLHSRTGSENGSRGSMDSFRTPEVSRVSTPNPAGGGQASGEAARDGPLGSGEDETLRHLTCLAVDLVHLSASLDGLFDDVIRPRLFFRIDTEARNGQDEEADVELVAFLRATLEETMSFRHSLIDQIGRVVTALLRTRCCDPLRLVRSVSSQYRSTSPSLSQGSKVEPSSYIAQVLQPLHVYFGLAAATKSGTSTRAGGAAVHLPAPLKTEWTTAVLADLVGRYTSSLITMNKNHESLRRLKRGGAGGGGLSSFASSLFSSSSASSAPAGEDEAGERLHRQMATDVEALKAGIEALQSAGVVVELDRIGWSRLEYAAKGRCEEL